jgi:uncharacterized protein YjgD (DUF1641 family)
MAKPIQLDFPTRNRELELRYRLEQAPIEHAEAILEFIELLEELHRHNVLNTLRGAVGAGDKIVGTLSNSAAQPETLRAMRNFIALTKLFGKIDPELIEAVQRAIPPELQDSRQRRSTRPPSILAIARTFWSPPVRRALMATGLVLAGIGYYMNKERPSSADQA